MPRDELGELLVELERNRAVIRVHRRGGDHPGATISLDREGSGAPRNIDLRDHELAHVEAALRRARLGWGSYYTEPPKVEAKPREWFKEIGIEPIADDEEEE